MSFDYYRDRVLRSGNTNQKRIVYEREKSFEEYLKFIPNAYTVIIDEQEYRVAIQDVRLHDDLLEDKYMLTQVNLPIIIGNYVLWDDTNWLIRTKEHETIKGHQSYKISKCNQVLTWQDDSNVIHTTPCILADKTSVYSDGLSKTEFISMGTDQTSIVVQANEDTLKIPINKRFIFKNDGNNIYEVNRRDNLTLDGLISFVVKKSLYDPLYDNLELNLANWNGKHPEPEEPEVPDGLVITGLDKIDVYMRNVEYSINTDKEVAWTLSRTDIIKFVSKADNKCFIERVSTSKIGKFVLKATLVEDETIFVEKNIEIAYA